MGPSMHAGGIQRYLEVFPDSGFFTGKNFVFDERLAVGGESPCPRADQVVGRCMKCSCKTDDYSECTTDESLISLP